MRATTFQGVYALLLTPFEPGGKVDWQTYDRYVHWQAQARPDGFFAVCGSSEMKWLTLEERLRLAEAAVSASNEIPVVATANLGNDMASHGTEIERMAETGVDGVVLVPPPGLGEDQQRLGEYFGRLADRAPCPVLLYEWPMVHPYLVEARIYGDLVRAHHVAGIKDTTCTMEGITAKLAVKGASTVFQANAPFLAESVKAGAGGMMAITTTAAADLARDFWDAQTAAGRHSGPESQDAARLHQLLVLLDCALIRGDAYPASAKHLASLRGFPMDTTCRNPVRLVPESARAVEVWLRHFEALRAVRSGGAAR